MKTYPPNLKPAELAEQRLIDAILDGSFPFESTLPPERELAVKLGVTRPTLREALQRLGRDGWIEIHQGKPTRVCNPWQEGNLAVLGHLANHTGHRYPQFVQDLLTVRCLLAPAYCQAAVEKAQDTVALFLTGMPALADSAAVYGNFDWDLHHQLTILSDNPVFTLILNGFSGMYQVLAENYFIQPDARLHSHNYYLALSQAASEGDSNKASEITRKVMQESIYFWLKVEM